MRIQLGRALVAALVLVAAGALPARAEDKKYPEGLEGLKQLWTDVLARAQEGKEDAVKEALAKMVMTPADFAEVIGDEAKAKDLAGKYEEKYAKPWPNEAKNIVEKVKKRGYDEVDVSDVTAADYAAQDAKEKGDLAKVVAALKPGTKMFRVKLKKKGEKTGLRYDSFFYVAGSWKAGLRLAKFVGGDEKHEKEGEKHDEKGGGEKGEKGGDKGDGGK